MTYLQDVACFIIEFSMGYKLLNKLFIRFHTFFLDIELCLVHDILSGQCLLS